MILLYNQTAGYVLGLRKFLHLLPEPRVRAEVERATTLALKLSALLFLNVIWGTRVASDLRIPDLVLCRSREPRYSLDSESFAPTPHSESSRTTCTCCRQARSSSRLAQSSATSKTKRLQ